MNRMRKFDEDETPKPPIVDGYDFVPDEPRKPPKSVVLSALSFIGSIGTILAVVSAVVFVAVYEARVAWKGF